MKQNIEFYPHYATSDQHAKFKMLRVQFGWEGEGKFWALNNRIALSEGCCLDISKKYNKAALASDLNFTLDEFTKFIIFLKDDCELIKECENGTITTDIIQEVFAKVMQDRGKARERHRRTSGEKVKTSGETLYRVKESKEKNKELTSFKKNEEDNEKDFYLTKKKKRLSGKRLETFLQFWEAFDYKKGKAEASDVWFEFPPLTNTVVDKIITVAKREALDRPELISSGKTPKMAQGWLSGRRWEDEPQSQSQPKIHKPTIEELVS